MTMVDSLVDRKMLSVAALSNGDQFRARTFAECYNLALAVEGESSISPTACETPYRLVFGSVAYLEAVGKRAPGPISASFIGGHNEHRRKFGGGKGQSIAKAVGLKPGVAPSVFDATAGLGRDAFVLASLGCRLSLAERSPVVFELLLSAVNQALNSEIHEIAKRITLFEGSSHEILSSGAYALADVIYLDPMYPHDEKSALGKKEMRYFRDLIGGDPDADNLLELAMARAIYRVVVKRPKKGVFLAGQPPSLQIIGKSTRFGLSIYSN